MIEATRDSHNEASDALLQRIIRRLDDEVYVISLDRIVGNPERIALGVADAILDFLVQCRQSQIGQI